jgi:hypothetical protein
MALLLALMVMAGGYIPTIPVGCLMKPSDTMSHRHGTYGPPTEEDLKDPTDESDSGVIDNYKEGKYKDKDKHKDDD